MKTEAILIVLKYTGALIASAYGLYATLTDFREEKDGKKILSSKGKYGIALLLVSSMLALSTDVVKDVRENEKKEEADKAEKIRQAEAEIKQRELVGRMNNQIDISRGVSSQLAGTAEKLDANITTTKDVSNKLNGAVKTLGGISQTTTRRNQLSQLCHPVRCRPA